MSLMKQLVKPIKSTTVSKSVTNEDDDPVAELGDVGEQPDSFRVAKGPLPPISRIAVITRALSSCLQMVKTHSIL